MQNRNVHGIFSLIFVTLAFLLGITIVFINSPLIGGLLAITLVLFFILVPRQVCSKCPARKECGHVLLGKLSIRLAPYCPDAMGVSDLIILVGLMLPLVVVPQFWLFKYPVLLMLFWVMMVVSAVDILRFVCPTCGNTKCPLNKGFTQG